MASHLPDELLACRAAAGRTDDFEELLRRYRSRVYRICYRMAGNAEDAEDWAQECLVRVYRQLGRYDPELPFAPWLMRVVANACINLAKTRSRRQSWVELGLDEETERVAPASDPAQAVLTGEDGRRIRAARAGRTIVPGAGGGAGRAAANGGVPRPPGAAPGPPEAGT